MTRAVVFGTFPAMKRPLLAFGVLLLAWPAFAETNLVAVLPLGEPVAATLGDQERNGLLTTIQSRAAGELGPLGYTVLTQANTLDILRDNDVSLDKICDSSCALRAAREIKARLFITGSIVKIDGTYRLTLTINEAVTGQQLADLTLQANRVLDLINKVESQSSGFFEPGVAHVESSVQVTAVTPMASPTAPATAQRSLPATIEVSAKGLDGMELTDAQMFIDGAAPATVPSAVPVSAGQHVVRVVAPLYLPRTTSVTLRAGDVKKLDFSLDPDFGIVSITSNPPGGAALVDGLPIGTTPVEQLHLRTGPHTIAVRLAEYVMATANIVVRPGQKLVIPLTLAADFGPFSCNSRPDGAAVFIDGESVGTTPLSLPRVKAGVHKVEVHGNPLAYEIWRQSVAIKPGANAAELNAKLVRREAEVLFITQPPGAEIILDGVNMGTTTAKLKILGGEYDLRLNLQGYAPTLQHLRVTPPEPLTINVKLSHGGSGPRGEYTLDDLQLKYRAPPPAPDLMPTTHGEQQHNDNVAGYLLAGAGFGVLGGAAVYYFVANQTGNSSGAPAIASGAGTFVATAALYTVIRHFSSPTMTVQMQDTEAVEDNRARTQAYRQQLSEVDAYNQEVERKVQAANAAIGITKTVSAPKPKAVVAVALERRSDGRELRKSQLDSPQLIQCDSMLSNVFTLRDSLTQTVDSNQARGLTQQVKSEEWTATQLEGCETKFGPLYAYTRLGASPKRSALRVHARMTSEQCDDLTDRIGEFDSQLADYMTGSHSDDLDAPTMQATLNSQKQIVLDLRTRCDP